MIRIEPTISAPGRAIDWKPARLPVDRQPERPLLLTLVAFLLIASGIGLAAVTLYAWSELHAMVVDLALGEYWPHALLVLAAASLLAGLLLLSGAPAGWYLALLVLANSFLASIQAGLLALDFGIPLALTDGDTISWYVKSGVRAFLSLLLLCYLLTSGVRRCYGVPVWKGVACMSVFAIAGTAFAVTNYLYG